MYSCYRMNFIQHNCTCICHGTDCFMYIIYLDTELYPDVQSGRCVVLCTDHSLYSLYVILNSLWTSCPQFMFALPSFLAGGLWNPN